MDANVSSSWRHFTVKSTRIIGVATLIVGSALAMGLASAQQQWQGIRRTALQRHALSAPGREVVQDRVDFDPGAVAPRHKHPGEEIVYVIEGSLEYQIEGQPPVTVKAGDVLFIPAGAIHAVRNVGRGKGAELATYVVERGRPLLVLAK
jgi:quercetin dioxygenase-like cupin family protein